MSPFDDLAARLDAMPEHERRKIGAQVINEQLLRAMLVAIKSGKLPTIIDLASPTSALKLLDVLGTEVYKIIEETLPKLTRVRMPFAQPGGPSKMADGG